MTLNLNGHSGWLLVAAALSAGCASDADSPSANPAASGSAGGPVTNTGGQAAAGGSGASGKAGSSSGAGGDPASMAGTSATGGTTGGATGGGGTSGSTPSPGCGTAASQVLNEWVEQPKLQVAGVDRQWWVWLPNNYDPARAYPVVFAFHGCSNASNIVPMQKETGDDAILVRGTGISDNVCWDASAGGDDLSFFDQMLAGVLANHCVDSSRVFATGYSSGSWLINMLECQRGDKFRATGTVSGGTPGPQNNCKGKFARIFVHDADDQDNKIQGSISERDRVLTQNHCTAGADPVAEAPAPCARYQGCDAGFPVIWCQTSGKGHDRQDALAPGAFWGLFSSL